MWRYASHRDSGNYLSEEYRFSFRTEDVTPPQANVGSDKEVDEDIVVELNASLSSDNVKIVNWTWSFVDQGEKVFLYGEIVNYTFSQPGDYESTLNVSDAAGNWAVDVVNITVKDVTPPDTTITDIPDYVNSLNSITGTASDAFSGVKVAQIRIYNVTGGANWNGTAWSTAETWLDATGYTDWSYNSSGVTWQDGWSYKIYAKATDNATNVDGTPASDTFGFDTTPPQISNISANPCVQAQGSNVNITCSVSDNVEVSKVKVIITGQKVLSR